MAARNGFSSLAYSVQAYQPYYAPPVTPQTNYINGGSSVAVPSIRAWIPWDQHNTMVNRNPRRLGIRTLFSYGGQVRPLFRMIATGRVESSQFQKITRHMWSGEFNDAIYQAGYPRNLGTTIKVPTVSREALGAAPWQMQPRPRITRTIFVNRATASGLASLPATSTQGAYS